MTRLIALQTTAGTSNLRWALVDFCFFFGAVLFALVLRFELAVKAEMFTSALPIALVFALVGVSSGLPFRLYAGRYVFGSREELKGLLSALLLNTAVSGLFNIFAGLAVGAPRSLVFIAAPLAVVLSGGSRLLVRSWSVRKRVVTGNRPRALIYGAGDAAETLIPQLFEVPDSPYEPVVLAEDSPEKKNLWIRGVPVGGKWEDIADLAQRFDVSVVIVAIPSADSELLSKVYKDSHSLGLPVVVLPSLREYLGGLQTPSELRGMSIEDLLGRQPVELDAGLISQFVRGKNVLVTGAAGSIGSELARQISAFEPGLLTLVDRDESGLLDASMKIPVRKGVSSCETYLADIRDKEAIDLLFRSKRPEVVFHAAALKHLPMLEAFPNEAWKTNVLGTLNVLEASRAVGVAALVNISTDKAADAINVLGKSKKIGERITAWFGAEADSTYVSVRFGNVLGSRGSLIPVLSSQIAAGGPVTVTDKRATRYFMSIAEACQLVLQAAALGQAGDVMVLDMGAPVSIDDVAKKMIQLSGRNVAVHYVGLRPGEKLHEDLLAADESPLNSAHPKIMRIRALPLDPEEVLASPWT